MKHHLVGKILQLKNSREYYQYGSLLATNSSKCQEELFHSFSPFKLTEQVLSKASLNKFLSICYPTILIFQSTYFEYERFFVDKFLHLKAVVPILLTTYDTIFQWKWVLKKTKIKVNYFQHVINFVTIRLDYIWEGTYVT